MHSHNKETVLDRWLAYLPIRYYVIILLIMLGFGMHLSSRVNITPTQISQNITTQNMRDTEECVVTHSIYMAVIRQMKLSHQVLNTVQHVLGTRLALNRAIQSGDILRLHFDRQHQRLIGIELVQKTHHWSFTLDPSTDTWRSIS